MVTPNSSPLGVRGTAFILLTLLGAAVWVGLRFGEFPVGAGMDDAYYIELARSLAEGHGPVIRINEAGPGWRPDAPPLPWGRRSLSTGRGLCGVLPWFC